MAEQGGRGGDRAALPGSAPSARQNTVTPGSLEDARSVLWAALKRAERALEAKDHSTALKGVHAVSQASTAYARLVETGELEARIRALEEERGSV